MSDPRQRTNDGTARLALWDASLALQGYWLCHGHPSASTMLAELEISCAGWHPLHWCGNRFPMRLRSASNTSVSRETVEKVCSFLVREALCYAEFSEAIIRLYEEKNGIQQHDLDFDFPPDDEEWEQEEPWTSWGYEDEETQTSPVGSTHAAAADSGSPHGNYARATTSSSPSRHSAGVQWDLPGVTELSLADSFVLGVLRGFRLLQASGLSPDDMRDIISTTKGSLEFEVVTKALQTLWDDQLVGRRHAGGWSPSKTHEAMFEEATSPSDDWWDDANVAQYDDNYDDWWQDDEEWGYAIEEHEGTKASEEDDDAIKEAQKAEQIAEGLAMEAQRSWAEAQRATQALRKDRGFGHLIGGGKGSSPARCWTCGGPHFSRDCPDRRHPSVGKGKGWKGHYMTDELYYMKGKGKKGKTASWMELQAFQKGKSSKSGKGKKGTRDHVTTFRQCLHQRAFWFRVFWSLGCPFSDITCGYHGTSHGPHRLRILPGHRLQSRPWSHPF